jgi:hypothetical protein
MSITLKNVSNEEKLRAAKDIVVAYINNSMERKGDDWSKNFRCHARRRICRKGNICHDCTS